MKTQELGCIVSGSLSQGFLMRLNPSYDLEELKSGRFVSIQGAYITFFSLLTDIQLNPIHNFDQIHYIDRNSLSHEVLQSTACSAYATIRPLIGLTQNKEITPVKSIPNHFAPVHPATAEDIAHIFGSPARSPGKAFAIGTPLDMTTDVCIDLEKFTERSSGIFGKTGTGKTFITRLLLAGLLQNRRATCLIFDMHSEYGLQARNENSNTPFVKGLKTLFPTQTAIFSLDPQATRRRGGNPDICLHIPLQNIGVGDILALSSELNLHPTACEAAYLLAARYKKDWLIQLLDRGNQSAELAQELGAHPESIAALYRKLRILERYHFFTRDNQGNQSPIQTLMEYLEKDISVIVEFGTYSSTFCYLLLANIITRRIHAQYIEKTEQFLASQAKQDEPKKLLIIIEEAHKFLNPTAAQQTIFGTIAREMRKYYVSLLIVDQRPSGIDPEILSQIGTKFIAQLHDEKDISAVLCGISGAQELKTVLATLSSKQQALVLGHAITTPIVIETRRYDEQFYQTVSTHSQIQDTINQLF